MFHFRCLLGELQLQPAAVCQVVLACAVLHNMARRANLPEPELALDTEVDQPAMQPNYQNSRSGIDTRRPLIDQYFA